MLSLSLFFLTVSSLFSSCKIDVNVIENKH